MQPASQCAWLYVMPLGPNYMSYADFPPWMLPLLPAHEPTAPT